MIPLFSEEYENQNNFCSAIDSIIASSKLHNKEIISDEDALQLLINSDLLRIKNAILNIDDSKNLISISGLENDLFFCAEKLNELGSTIEPPFFDVVDQFPPPFDKFKWSAFCPDSEDERRYNIQKGIYFRKDSIRPFYSRVLLAHELIHTVSGKKDPEFLAMGLEEGIAEILGSIYLGSKLVGMQTAMNVFIYNRFSYPISNIWKLYLDHTRQAFLIYNKFGMSGLVTLLNQGRKAIHDAEKLILRNEISKLELPSGNFENEVSNILYYLLLGFLPNYIVNPLKFYLLQFIEEHLMVKTICEKASVPYSIGSEEIEHLSNETLLFVIDDGIIQYSNANLYLSIREHDINIIRYSL